MFISHFKSLSGKLVIRDFSLIIESGSFTTLHVLLACGKTTLLRMIAGLDVLGEVKQMGLTPAFFSGWCRMPLRPTKATQS